MHCNGSNLDRNAKGSWQLVRSLGQK